MELRQLEYFVAVAEEANFTRAAERVHISQSGVSAQLRQLERELGTELIDRSSRTATLTPAGESALAHARAALASAGALRQAVDDVTGVIRGRLVVGMVVGCTVEALFEGLSSFHRAHPGVEVTLVEDNSEDLVRGVRAGAVDLALIGVAGETPSGLGSTTIVSESLVALVPANHPLADRGTVTLAEIADHPLVCMPEGTGIRTGLDRAYATQGLRPTVALQASAPGTIADLAARGLGIGVLSTSMAERFDLGLIALPIVDALTPVLLALVWSSRSSPALVALGRHVHAGFGR
jgi:DNA-binding transcriptional LysR family regulator